MPVITPCLAVFWQAWRESWGSITAAWGAPTHRGPDSRRYPPLPRQAPQLHPLPKPGAWGPATPLPPCTHCATACTHTSTTLSPTAWGHTRSVNSSCIHTRVHPLPPPHATLGEHTRLHVHTLVVHTYVCSRIVRPQVVRTCWAAAVLQLYALSPSSLAPFCGADTEPREMQQPSQGDAADGGGGRSGSLVSLCHPGAHHMSSYVYLPVQLSAHEHVHACTCTCVYHTQVTCNLHAPKYRYQCTVWAFTQTHRRVGVLSTCTHTQLHTCAYVLGSYTVHTPQTCRLPVIKLLQVLAPHFLMKGK